MIEILDEKLTPFLLKRIKINFSQNNRCFLNRFLKILNFRGSKTFPIFIVSVLFEKLIFTNHFIIIFAIRRCNIEYMRIIFHQKLNIFYWLKPASRKYIVFLNIKIFFVFWILIAFFLNFVFLKSAQPFHKSLSAYFQVRWDLIFYNKKVDHCSKPLQD
jgi:hypothetical protein